MSLQHITFLPEGVDLLKRDVALSNALTRSSLSLNLYEKRLINAALAKLGKRPWPPGFMDTPFSVHEANWDDWIKLENSPFCVHVSAADYAKAANVSKSTAYEQLKEASASLYHRSIHMRVRTEKGVEVREIRWLSERRYHDGEGYVEIFWSPQVARHIYSLKNKFTLYKLHQTSRLTNIHAVRLFEQFASWAPDDEVLKGSYAPTIEEFIEAVEVPEGYHSDFAGIRRRVIEKAIDMLTKELNLSIQWDVKKRGKKVIGLQFNYAPAPEGEHEQPADEANQPEDQ